MDNNIQYNILPTCILDKFSEWVKRKHPTSWQQYRNFVRRFPAPDSFPDWLEKLPKSEYLHARKAARKLRDFLLADGNWELAEAWGKASGKPVFLTQPQGTLRQRQTQIMLTLRGITGLPARKIGMLRFADYTWLRKEYPSCSTILDEWVRLRERCLADPEFFRKMRLQTSWAQSEYLFPSSRGGPSRLRVTSKKQPYQTSLTQITNRSSQSYEKGKCYRTEAIILDGEIFVLSELDHTKKESLFLNPKAVLIEAWFRKTESGWEGPFYVPFD